MSAHRQRVRRSHTHGSGCASGCRAGRARARWRSCATAPVLPRPWTRPWERRSMRQSPLEPRGVTSVRFLNWPRLPRPGRTSSMHLRRAGAGCGARSGEPHERVRGRPGPPPQAGPLVLERGGRRSAGVPGGRHRCAAVRARWRLGDSGRLPVFRRGCIAGVLRLPAAAAAPRPRPPLPAVAGPPAVVGPAAHHPVRIQRTSQSRRRAVWPRRGV